MLLSVFQADVQPTSVAWPLQPIVVHPVAKLGQVHLRQRAQDERCVSQLKCLSFTPLSHTAARDSCLDSASFAAAFKRMRAAGKESASIVTEPSNSGQAALPLRALESESAAALQMQLQVALLLGACSFAAPVLTLSRPFALVHRPITVVLICSPHRRLSLLSFLSFCSSHHSSQIRALRHRPLILL